MISRKKDIIAKSKQNFYILLLVISKEISDLMKIYLVKHVLWRKILSISFTVVDAPTI